MKDRFFQDARVSDFLALQKLLEEKVPIYALKWRMKGVMLQKALEDI
jgi:hypothetical protein